VKPVASRSTSASSATSSSKASDFVCTPIEPLSSLARRT
jgi:hypothetical protein